METKFKCDCGHTENESDVHSVADYKNMFVIDLCDKCYGIAPLTESNERLSSTQFIDENQQRIFLNLK